MKINKLTIKQEAFCQAFVRLGDKSAAYREAYNTSKMKSETIHKRASELFNNREVSGRIDELQAKVAVIAEKKFNITHEEILNHLNILRNSRIDEYVEIKEVSVPITNKAGRKTRSTKETRLVFKPFDKLTKEQLMCIESIKQDRFGNIEIKLHGKDWSIDKINKHIGFYEKNNTQKQPVINVDNTDLDSVNKRIAELVAKATK